MAELTLSITFDPSNGQLGLNASPEVAGNQILAFGMLEAGKQAIIQIAAANERRVQPASVLPPGFPAGK